MRKLIKVDCIECNTNVDYHNQGKDQLLSHASTKKHSKQAGIVLSSSQEKLIFDGIKDGEKKLTLTSSGDSNKTTGNMNHL